MPTQAIICVFRAIKIHNRYGLSIQMKQAQNSDSKSHVNKLEIFEDALFESGKTSTHRTGITCTLINLNTENGERKKLNWAIFEQLPIYHIHP